MCNPDIYISLKDFKKKMLYYNRENIAFGDGIVQNKKLDWKFDAEQHDKTRGEVSNELRKEQGLKYIRKYIKRTTM